MSSIHHFILLDICVEFCRSSSMNSRVMAENMICGVTAAFDVRPLNCNQVSLRWRLCRMWWSPLRSLLWYCFFPEKRMGSGAGGGQPENNTSSQLQRNKNLFSVIKIQQRRIAMKLHISRARSRCSATGNAPVCKIWTISYFYSGPKHPLSGCDSAEECNRSSIMESDCGF